MIYALGGNDGSASLNSMERFDHVIPYFSFIVIITLRLTSVCNFDLKIFMLSHFRYDPKMNKWVLVTSMTARRSSVGATVLECFALEKIINAGKPVI